MIAIAHIQETGETAPPVYVGVLFICSRNLYGFNSRITHQKSIEYKGQWYNRDADPNHAPILHSSKVIVVRSVFTMDAA